MELFPLARKERNTQGDVVGKKCVFLFITESDIELNNLFL
jgi:hypothetical protein